MKPAAYAEALYELARDADEAALDRIVANTAALLSARGHRALLPAIVRELEKLERRRQTANECVVRVARTADAERYRAAWSADAEALGSAALPVRVTEDVHALGGYEVRACGKRIDRTYKRSLVELYQTLISSS